MLNLQQKERGEEGGVYPGATAGEQQARRRRGDSVWSLGVEEIRPETHQGLALPKVPTHLFFIFPFNLLLAMQIINKHLIMIQLILINIRSLSLPSILFLKRIAAVSFYCTGTRCRERCNIKNQCFHFINNMHCSYVQVYHSKSTETMHGHLR